MALGAGATGTSVVPADPEVHDANRLGQGRRLKVLSVARQWNVRF
jgi:hypothetical protein